MKNIINFINKYDFLLKIIFVAFLFFISVFFSHLYWFIPNAILQFGDWGYRYSEYAKDLFLEWGSWSSAFQTGESNIVLFAYPVRGLLWSFLVKLGLNFDNTLKVGILIPVAALGFISPYLFAWIKTRNVYISSIIAFFYSSIPYFLVTQTAHLPISFVFAFAPLLFVLLEKAVIEKKIQLWLIFIFCFQVCLAYELRIVFIISILLFVYYLFLISNFGLDFLRFKQALISISILFFLQLYWLLPIIFGGSEKYLEVANRGLFGDNLFDIFHAITITKWNWTWQGVDWSFTLMQVPIYLFIIPIFVIGGFVFLLTYRKEKYLLIYYGLLILMGILLTKQSAQPLQNLYLWFYNNIPGFNLFREASKFYVITSIGYLGILTLFLNELYKQKKIVYLTSICFILFFFSFINLFPYMTRSIGAVFVPRHIPEDYLEFSNAIDFEKDDSFYRTLWIPRGSNFILNGYLRPKIDFVSVLSKEWENYVDKNLPILPNPYIPRIINMLNKQYLDRLLDVSSVKYVGVPIVDKINDDDFFVSYGEKDNPNIREWYISELDKIRWLERIDIGTKDLVIYENKDFKPHVYLTKEKENINFNIPFEKVEYLQKNPTEYRISLKNLNKQTYLNFSESYHPDWKIRIGKFGWFSALLHRDYFLPDEFHLKNNANLSTFKIDPNFIKENYPGSYTENPDGSINVDLTLFFKPQSYFYLGLIISITTFLGCLAYLAHDFIKRRKIKKEQNGEIPEKIL